MKKTAFYTVGISLSISMLGGCASHKSKQPQVIESFTTNILPSGEKQFQFQLSMSRPEGRRGGGGPRGGHGGGRGGPPPGGGSHGSPGGPPPGGGRGGSKGSPKGDPREMEEKMRTMLTDRLDARIQENGYCREGFAILLQDIGMFGKSLVRAQCNELATEEDKAAFPNSEPKPQKPRVIYESLD